MPEVHSIDGDVLKYWQNSKHDYQDYNEINGHWHSSKENTDTENFQSSKFDDILGNDFYQDESQEDMDMAESSLQVRYRRLIFS